MQRLLRFGAAVVVIALAVACEGRAPTDTAEAPVPTKATSRFDLRWETPSDYSQATPRKIGRRAKNTTGKYSYSVDDLHVAFRVADAGSQPPEWIEWWQIQLWKGVRTPATFCQLTRLQLRDRDQTGAVLPHIDTISTSEESMRMEMEEWEDGRLGMSMSMPLETLQVRLNFTWSNNEMILQGLSAAGTREHVGAGRVEAVQFSPVAESQILTVPVAIRGLQEPTNR